MTARHPNRAQRDLSGSEAVSIVRTPAPSRPGPIPQGRVVHRTPPKPADVALNDARFHLLNAAHSLDVARKGLGGDSAERMRVRLRAIRRERKRLELFMDRHFIALRTPRTGPVK